MSTWAQNLKIVTGSFSLPPTSWLRYWELTKNARHVDKISLYITSWQAPLSPSLHRTCELCVGGTVMGGCSVWAETSEKLTAPAKPLRVVRAVHLVLVTVNPQPVTLLVFPLPGNLHHWHSLQNLPLWQTASKHKILQTVNVWASATEIVSVWDVRDRYFDKPSEYVTKITPYWLIMIRL